MNKKFNDKKYCNGCQRYHPASRSHWQYFHGNPKNCKIMATYRKSGNRKAYFESATIYIDSLCTIKKCVTCMKTKPASKFVVNSYSCNDCCYIDTPNFKCYRCKKVQPTENRSGLVSYCKACQKEMNIERNGEDRLKLSRLGKMRCKNCHMVYAPFISGSYSCNRCKNSYRSYLIQQFDMAATKYDVVVKLNNNLFPQVVKPKNKRIGILDIKIPKVFDHVFEQPKFEIVLIEPFKEGWKEELLATDKFQLKAGSANWYSCRDVFNKRLAESVQRPKRYEKLAKTMVI